MGYSAEVIQRARARLEQARADREAENRQHLETAYREVPRIRQIDQQLRQTMASAMQAAFAKGTDVRQAMDAIRQENLLLQQERAALAEEYFGEGYLDETPICDRCGGTGYVGSTMCESLMELCRQEQKKELTFLSAGRESFDQFRLEYYPDRVDPVTGFNIRAIMDRTYQTCRRYAQTFSEKSGNLLFSGDTGLGKTFLSACIARTVADGGHSVVYESAGHLFGKLERARFGGSEEERKDAEKYTACDLLILDDLGTEMATAFTQSALYNLIDGRLRAGKKTVISTNLTADELTGRYGPQLGSRLNGEYVHLEFLGRDIRALRKERG
jgi:DNA replication protein DnaC